MPDLTQQIRDRIDNGALPSHADYAAPAKLAAAILAVLDLAPPPSDRSWFSEGYRECHATMVRRIANALGIRETP